jgi:hypothetical protein
MQGRQTSRKVAGESLTNRSRITNGSALLPDVDGRSTWARRLRDVIQLHADDRGGDDALSEAERSILRRAATLTVELEFQESKLAQLREEGREPSADSLELYARCASHLRRLLEAVGIQRRPRDVDSGRRGVLEAYLEPDDVVSVR